MLVRIETTWPQRCVGAIFGIVFAISKQIPVLRVDVALTARSKKVLVYRNISVAGSDAF